MSIYVGIDVHRKRSQVAVVGEDGRVQLNRRVVNGSAPTVGGDQPRCPVGVMPLLVAGTASRPGLRAREQSLRCRGRGGWWGGWFGFDEDAVGVFVGQVP